MTQIRQTKTKEAIKSALTQLLQTEPFEKISVSKLCKLAGINRGTFYLHYEDKYQMMEQMKEETFWELSQIFHSPLPIKEAIQASFDYIKNNRNFIKVLSQSLPIDFHHGLQDGIQLLFESSIQSGKCQKFQTPLPHPYDLRAFLASIESIFATWIHMDGQEDSAQLADMVLQVAQLYGVAFL